jgi:hypothetical protein
MIDLGGVIEDVSISVFNRCDAFSWRNWSMKVERSRDSLTWITDHDHLKYQEALKILTRSFLKNGNRSTRICIDFILTYVSSGNIDDIELRKECERHGVKYGPVANFLNKYFLYDFKMELSSHGFTKTFRFWQEHEKQEYLKGANEIINSLRTLTNNVTVGYGTVLSYVRHGHLMDHDDDIDVVIFLDKSSAPTIQDAMAIVVKTLRDGGFTVDGNTHMWAHRWVRKETGPVYDVFVGIVHDGYLAAYPGPRHKLRLSDVFPVMDVKLHGSLVPIPKDPFTYLEHVYGPSWRTPNLAFGHRWDKREFQDLDKDASSPVNGEM